MIVMKRLFTGLLIVCMLCTLTACASEKDTVHPPEFQKLSALLPSPMEDFYKGIGKTEADVTKVQSTIYQLSEEVSFCDLPFALWFQHDPVNDYFMGIYYEHVLTGSYEEMAADVLTIAQHFTDTLGPSDDHILAPYDPSEPSRFAEMTVAELAEKMASNDQNNTRDYWCLGVLDADNMKSYMAALQSMDPKYHRPDADAVPMLMLRMDTGTGRNGMSVMLTYYIDYDWHNMETQWQAVHGS